MAFDWSIVAGAADSLMGGLISIGENKKNREAQKEIEAENRESQERINEANNLATAEQNQKDRDWQMIENDKARRWQETENIAQREWEKEQQQNANDIDLRNFQATQDELDYQHELQQTMFEREDTAYQRTAEDMKAAGLNPLTMNGTNAAGNVVSTTAAQQNNTVIDREPGEVVKGDTIQGKVATMQAYRAEAFKNDIDFINMFNGLTDAIQGGADRKLEREKFEESVRQADERLNEQKRHNLVQEESENPKWRAINALMDVIGRKTGLFDWNNGSFKIFNDDGAKADGTPAQRAADDAYKMLEEMWQTKKNEIGKKREEAARYGNGRSGYTGNGYKQTAYEDGTIRAKVVQAGMNYFNKVKNKKKKK